MWSVPVTVGKLHSGERVRELRGGGREEREATDRDY